jgi:hypothetical protein
VRCNDPRPVVAEQCHRRAVRVERPWRDDRRGILSQVRTGPSPPSHGAQTRSRKHPAVVASLPAERRRLPCHCAPSTQAVHASLEGQTDSLPGSRGSSPSTGEHVDSESVRQVERCRPIRVAIAVSATSSDSMTTPSRSPPPARPRCVCYSGAGLMDEPGDEVP